MNNSDSSNNNDGSGFNQEDQLSVFERFWLQYSTIHPPLVITICVLGVASNLVNVVVLTRPHMLKSPTNILLCGLSFAQLCLLVNFVTYSIYRYILDGPCNLEFKSFDWLVFLAVNVNINIIFHTIAIFHTLWLALFRLLSLRHPNTGVVTRYRVQLAVFFTYVLSPFLTVSFMWNTTIDSMNASVYNCSSAFSTADNQDHHRHKLETNPDKLLFHLSFRKIWLMQLNFFLFAIIWKILPCLTLLILSPMLIQKMYTAMVHRNRILKVVVIETEPRSTALQYSEQTVIGDETEASAAPRYSSRSSKSKRTARDKRAKQLHRTTRMLVLISLMVLVVELPQGIITTAAAILGDTFRNQVYNPLGDLFELLTVLYSSINFVLYCTTSSLFRRTFSEIFWIPSAASNRRTGGGHSFGGLSRRERRRQRQAFRSSSDSTTRTAAAASKPATLFPFYHDEPTCIPKVSRSCYEAPTTSSYNKCHGTTTTTPTIPKTPPPPALSLSLGNPSFKINLPFNVSLSPGVNFSKSQEIIQSQRQCFQMPRKNSSLRQISMI